VKFYDPDQRGYDVLAEAFEAKITKGLALDMDSYQWSSSLIGQEIMVVGGSARPTSTGANVWQQHLRGVVKALTPPSLVIDVQGDEVAVRLDDIRKASLGPF
jgi:hypothetical protein